MTTQIRGMAAEIARNRIRDAIVDGSLRPGQRLNQAELASAYGLSRSPIREALRQLANDGLVTLKTNATAEVTELSAAEFDEIYRLRERLDPVALASSMERLTDDDLERLRSYVREMDAASNSDLVRFEHLDRSFHFHGRSRAALPQFRRILDSLWDMTVHYRHSFWVTSAALETTQREHWLILDAIERRDPEDADRLLTTHIRRTRLVMGGRPETFDADHLTPAVDS